MTRRISCARLRRPVHLVLLKLHPKWLQFFCRRVILGGSLVPELQRPRLARRRISDFYLQADRILPSPFGKWDQSAGCNPAIQQIKNPRYFQLWTSEGTSAKSGLSAGEFLIWLWCRQVRSLGFRGKTQFAAAD